MMRGPILLTLLAVTACAGGIDAPSLAPRAAERQPIELPSEPVEPAGATDPALAARLAAIVAAAAQNDGAFQKERAATEAIVLRAAGAPSGSDRWLTAQQALSAFETTLGPVRDAAAAIDGMRSDPANAAPGNRAAIDAAQAQVEALADTQRAALAALSARLG